MTAAVADTHAAIWFLLEPSQLSRAAFEVLAEAYLLGDPIDLASISLVATQYLEERGRVRAGTLARLVTELQSSGAVLTLVSLDEQIALPSAVSLVALCRICPTASSPPPRSTLTCPSSPVTIASVTAASRRSGKGG